MNDRIGVMSKSEVYGLGITGFLVKRNSIDKAVIIEYKLNIQGVSVKVTFSPSMSQGLNLIKYC